MAINTGNLDQGSDKIKAARPDLLQCVQVVNDLSDATDVAKGDAGLAVQKTFIDALPTTQHEVNERGMHLFDFCSGAQKASMLAGDFLVDVQDAWQKMVYASIASGIKKMKFSGRGIVMGVPGGDTMNNGILVPLALTLNADPYDQMIIEGDGAGAVMKCGSSGMIMFRCSHNLLLMRDMTIDGGSLDGLTDTWCAAVVPESMTQTTTLVNQSLLTFKNLHRVNATEGLVFQPGPRVSGADSGIFYQEIDGGYSNNIVRHVWSKKGSTWAVDVNRMTRTQFKAQRLTRGNVGYQFDVGSEITIEGNEEQINRTTGPLGTSATARYISGDCTNITFMNGYSENCTESFFGAANNVISFGYIPASGSDLLFNRYVSSYEDTAFVNRPLTPSIVGSGGGTLGTNASFGRSTKRGKLHRGVMHLDAAKGSISGSIVVSGFPFLAESATWGAQNVSVESWTNVTFPALAVKLCARFSGAASIVLFFSTNGAGTIALDATHLASSFTIDLSFEINAQ